jgi:hypothetical protein
VAGEHSLPSLDQFLSKISKRVAKQPAQLLPAHEAQTSQLSKADGVVGHLPNSEDSEVRHQKQEVVYKESLEHDSKLLKLDPRRTAKLRHKAEKMAEDNAAVKTFHQSALVEADLASSLRDVTSMARQQFSSDAKAAGDLARLEKSPFVRLHRKADKSASAVSHAEAVAARNDELNAARFLPASGASTLMQVDTAALKAAREEELGERLVAKDAAKLNHEQEIDQGERSDKKIAGAASKLSKDAAERYMALKHVEHREVAKLATQNVAGVEALKELEHEKQDGSSNLPGNLKAKYEQVLSLASTSQASDTALQNALVNLEVATAQAKAVKSFVDDACKRPYLYSEGAKPKVQQLKKRILDRIKHSHVSLKRTMALQSVIKKMASRLPKESQTSALKSMESLLNDDDKMASILEENVQAARDVPQMLASVEAQYIRNIIKMQQENARDVRGEAAAAVEKAASAQKLVDSQKNKVTAEQLANQAAISIGLQSLRAMRHMTQWLGVQTLHQVKSLKAALHSTDKRVALLAGTDEFASAADDEQSKAVRKDLHDLLDTESSKGSKITILADDLEQKSLSNMEQHADSTQLKADVKTIGLDERAGEDLKASEKASKGMMLTAESASDLVDADATHATHIAKRIEGLAYATASNLDDSSNSARKTEGLLRKAAKLG